MFLILLAGLQAIPTDPYEAAKVDGATWFQEFRHITFPLLTPAVLIAVLLRLMDTLRIFDQVFVMTGGGPANATETLSLFVYQTGFRFFDVGYATAMSFVLLILTTVISNIFIRPAAGRGGVHPMTWKVVRIIMLLLLAVIVIFPVVWVISTSVKSDVDIFAIPPILVPQHPTDGRYVQLWTYGLLAYLANSVIVAISTAVVTIVIGTLAAFSLARFRLPGKWTARVSFWILSTRMFPPIVTVIPLFQLMRFLGLVNTRLGLVLAYTAFNIPFVVWMMRGFFVEIPKDLEEVAMVDGCSRMRAFRSISLPLVVPGLAATAIFTIILSWQEFLFALILTQTSASSTLPILVSSQVTQYQILWGQMSAAGTITMVPVLIFAFSVQRYLVRGMSFGAIKG